MACNKLQMHELPGSYNSCQVLIVRECLEVNGADIGPGLTSVVTDGVTVQGAGTTLSPIAIKAVQHDGTLTGDGTVASPLSVPAGPPATVVTDGVSIAGDGSGGSPVRLLDVAASGMTGTGAPGNPLVCQTATGPGGIADTATASLITVTTVDPGNIAIQAQNIGAVGGQGNVAVTADGAGGSAVNLGCRTTGFVNLGIKSDDLGQAFSLQLRDGAASVPVVPVSDAGRARLRYNAGTNRLQVSLNGAAFVDIVTL